MTAFKNFPAWDDFERGRDSDMLRMRQRFTDMLEQKHEETMRKFSTMSSKDDEEAAFERWKEQLAQRPKNRKRALVHSCPAPLVLPAVGEATGWPQAPNVTATGLRKCRVQVDP